MSWRKVYIPFVVSRLSAGQTIADIFLAAVVSFTSLISFFLFSFFFFFSSPPFSFLLISPVSCITSHRSDASDDLCAVRRLRGGVDCASFTLRHSRLVERLSPYLFISEFFSLLEEIDVITNTWLDSGQFRIAARLAHPSTLWPSGFIILWNNFSIFLTSSNRLNRHRITTLQPSCVFG